MTNATQVGVVQPWRLQTTAFTHGHAASSCHLRASACIWRDTGDERPREYRFDTDVDHGSWRGSNQAAEGEGDVMGSSPAKPGCLGRLAGCGLTGVVLALVAVVSIAILAGGQLNSHVRVNGESRMLSYRQVDARTIAITMSVSPYGWTRLTGVVEASTEVRISVESLIIQIGPGAAYAQRVEMPVTLAQDLGDRAVADDVGDPVPQR